MSEKPVLTVYTLENCPNCEMLKGYLHSLRVTFAEKDMSSAESLTELRVNGVFAMEAPVLRKDETFLTSADLFSGGKVRAAELNRTLDLK
ncbi:MAG TPA: glutaredoxin domain-containing protein [Methanomicrobiales archaeon]|nr:glutaredoxin domain-containing protein [Methanomicrobiales archaeon]